MKTSLLLNRKMNDIIFENRNKSYGAFVLRQDYERTMSRAMISAFLFFLCCINTPNMIRLLQDRPLVDGIPYDNTPVNLDPIRNIAPKVKPPVVIPQKTPPSIKSQISYIAPAVKPDDLVIDEVDIPSVE